MAERIDKKAYIGGEWVESESGDRYEVRCPGDGSVLGTVANCTRKDAHAAVAAAIEGQKALAKLSMVSRIGMLKKALDISMRRADEAAKANTAREVYGWLQEEGDRGVFSLLTHKVARRAADRVGARTPVEAVLFGYQGECLAQVRMEEGGK